MWTMYQNYNVYIICAFASIGKLTADTSLPRKISWGHFQLTTSTRWWAIRFRTVVHVRRAWNICIYILFQGRGRVPPGRNHLRDARRIPCRGAHVLFHRGQVLSKVRHSNSRGDMDHWVDVSCLPTPHRTCSQQTVSKLLRMVLLSWSSVEPSLAWVSVLPRQSSPSIKPR